MVRFIQALFLPAGFIRWDSDSLLLSKRGRGDARRQSCEKTDTFDGHFILPRTEAAQTKNN